MCTLHWERRGPRPGELDGLDLDILKTGNVWLESLPNVFASLFCNEPA